ncbi:hotdog domain-containing protein [Rhodococcus sp. G-MC3]|uniref:hotdog domain-containing protein n=1 Tax=Rhodococcus sp. G-MC3 TaxID=3046209 RepID=UPI0024B8D0B2|nr:hotdog domain-containing protein [Rhodococcus sp. G-MC3]MDJ0392878.1 hotdog domain-containing protein [Rhodococcus sp. G-MC3]
MYRKTMALSHRPARDGTLIEVAHVPAYLALELATEAWAGALLEVSERVITAANVMIVNISSNFSRELLVGSVDVEVAVTRVGTSSLVLEVSIFQADIRSAVAAFTVVRVVDGAACPLTDAQRASIASLVSDQALQV